MLPIFLTREGAKIKNEEQKMAKKEIENKYIYISYDYDDCGMVFPLASAFKDEGYDVWMNTTISRSKEIEEEIETKIKDCSLFIFLASRQSLDNSACSRELRLADKYQKPLISVFLQEKYKKFEPYYNAKLKQFPIYEFCNYPTAEAFVIDLEKSNPEFKKLKKKNYKKPVPANVAHKKATNKAPLSEYEAILKKKIKNNPEDFEYESVSSKKTLRKYKGDDPIVFVPETVTIICSYAFSFKRNVETIVISKNVRKIEKSALDCVHDLIKIIVDPNNPYYASLDGVLFDKDMKTLIHYPKRKGDVEYRVPSSVKTIKSEAFDFTFDLSSLVFDSDDLIIERRAIEFLFALKTITIKKRIKKIEKYAISCCNSIEKIFYYQKYSSWSLGTEYGFYANEKIGFFARLFGKKPHLVELNCKDRVVSIKPIDFKW